MPKRSPGRPERPLSHVGRGTHDSPVPAPTVIFATKRCSFAYHEWDGRAGLRSPGCRVQATMVFRDLIGDVLRTLWVHKLRTFLTMFGIAWGIVSIVLMVAAGEGLRKGQEEQARTFGKDVMIVFHGRTSMQAGGLRAGRLVQWQDSDIVCAYPAAGPDWSTCSNDSSQVSWSNRPPWSGPSCHGRTSNCPVPIASCTLIPASASRLRCSSRSSGLTRWNALSPRAKPSLMNEPSTLCSSSVLLKKAQM